MDIQLSEDQELFRETTRKFLESECPLTTVRQLHLDQNGFDSKYWRSGAELGWTTLLISEEDGGGSISGNGIADLMIVAEEMGRLVSPGPVIPVNIVAATISRSGSAEQRAQLIPGLLDGSSIATWAHNEKGMRWDASRMKTTAKADGDSFVINGEKYDVEAGAQAQTLLVSAMVDGEPAQFIVPANTPGVTVEQVDSIDMVKRFATVKLANVKVPASARVGVATASDDINTQMLTANVLQCAETCGAMDRAFEFTIEYLGDRYLFGRPLASYQALKHRAADWKMRLEASMAITTAAGRALGNGEHEGAELTHSAKSYVGGWSTELMQDMVQMNGGIGTTWEHDIHLYLRRATLNRSVYGSVADHREKLAQILDRVEVG